VRIYGRANKCNLFICSPFLKTVIFGRALYASLYIILMLSYCYNLYVSQFIFEGRYQTDVNTRNCIFIYEPIKHVYIFKIMHCENLFRMIMFCN
jgi:hypothetical protein